MPSYDVKCIMFHIGEKGRTSGKAINYSSFVETLNKPLIQDRLHNGLLMGLLTHDGRRTAREDKTNIPHHDAIMKDPDLCNILRAVTVKDGVVYGYLDLTDTPAAERFKNLWRQGVRIGTSMSTQLDSMPSDEFNVIELLGVDFTLRPEFESPIVEANFSEAQNRIDTNLNSKIQIGNFSVPADEDVLLMDNNTSSSNSFDFSESGDFNIREYLRDRSRRPAQVLRDRIQEVIRYIKVTRSARVQDAKMFLRRYITEYISEWITISVQDDASDLNLAIGLRLTDYCQDRTPARELSHALRMARSQINSSGSMMKEVQARLNRSFTGLMSQIFDYINRKVNDEEKAI